VHIRAILTCVTEVGFIIEKVDTVSDRHSLAATPINTNPSESEANQSGTAPEVDAVQANAPLPMSARRRRVVTAGVLMGMFLAALEMTIVGTAMPTVIAALGGLSHYSWVFSAYLITSTVPVPVWGKLSDVYGRGRLFQIGIAVFLLGSILSGMSATMTQLIIFRAIQGLGAGVLMPLAMTIIGDIYTLGERTRMQAVFSGVWGLSSLIGPLVGGIITDQFSWRWVFYINIPFGLAAALIIGLSLQEPKLRQRPNIDYAGAITLIIAVTMLMLALVQNDSQESGGRQTGLLNPLNMGLFFGALLLFGLFIGIEKRAIDPIMPPQLFGNRVVSISLLVGLCVGVAMFGTISFVPFFAQGVLGSTATEAGSFLTPLLMSWVVMGIIGARFLLRVGFRRTAIIGLSLMTLGSAGLSTSGQFTPRLLLILELAAIGSGLGLTVLTLILAAQHAVARTQLGLVTSLSQFSRSIGGAMGVAVMGLVLSSSLTSQILGMVGKVEGLTRAQASQLVAHPNALIDTAARTTLSAPVMAALKTALAASLGNVFWLCTACSLVGLIAVMWLPGTIAEPVTES
jgi:EmrB/QacA subfamily drug resistance transporter